jgi:cell division protein FtsA
MAKQGEIIAGLDLGTRKVACIVGEVTGAGVDIIGIGSQPSEGLRKGEVINVDDTVRSIQRAVEEAELMAGCDVNTVYTGMAGGEVEGFNSRGIVAVRGNEVGRGDLKRVVDGARAVAMPNDRDIIHVIPQEYIVDDQENIEEPLGMQGVRLEANAHIVTVSDTSRQNILKCAEECHLNVEEVVLEQLASAEAVIEEDEKELGVAVVDIGGGTTDIAIYADGSLVHTTVLSVGGNHLTEDIATGLRTPMEDAERIKRKFGAALMKKVNPEETIEVPSVGGRPPRVLSRQILSEIIEPRAEEIFDYVHREIVESGHRDTLAGGVVLTGGTSVLENLPELAEEVLDMPVRRGVPKDVGGLVDVVRNPKYATGVGLVLHGARRPERPVYEAPSESIYDRIKNFFFDFF